MKFVFIDFETYYSSKDYTLTKMGPLEYIRDPRFHALMMGICVDDGPVHVFEHDDIPTALKALELCKKDRCVVGHNLNGFDALILSEIYGVRPAWMLDTMVMMRWTGLSRIMCESHAALTEFLGSGTKWEGTVLSDGKKRKGDFTFYEWERFKQYCADDVSQCRDNAFKLMPYITSDVVTFSTLTARMATEPMLLLDKHMLEQHLLELEAETETARKNIYDLFKFNTAEEFLKGIRSPITFPNMLRTLMVEPPMKFSAAKTATYKAKLEAERDMLRSNQANLVRLAELDGILSDPDSYAQYTPALSKNDLGFLDLRDHPDPKVSLLVNTRLEQNSSIVQSRTRQMLKFADGRPTPIFLSAYKAHTSRYTAGNEGVSDKMNYQNFSKRDKKKAVLRKAIKVPAGYKLVAVDASQIEARINAYISNEVELLEGFRRGEDVYSQLGEKIFNRPWTDIRDGAKAGDPVSSMQRFVSKTGILSCGYGVSHKKFSDTLLRAGVKMHSDIDRHHELAKHAHEIYRLSNANIVRFWRRCQEVIEHMYIGGHGQFGGPNDDLFTYGTMPIAGSRVAVPSISIPTGYALRYPNLRVDYEEGKSKPQFFYDRQKGRNKVKTRIYGAALVENCCQMLSFQLLSMQAIAMFNDGIPIITNNHDCWVSVVPEGRAQYTLERMIYHMTQVPDWMNGFPIAAEGDIADDFSIA